MNISPNYTLCVGVRWDAIKHTLFWNIHMYFMKDLSLNSMANDKVHNMVCT